MDCLLKCICVFVGCIFFAVIFNIRGVNILVCAIGGTMGQLIFMILDAQDILKYFIAMCIVSIYCELMARYRKAPASLFLVIGLLPLVPGSGIFYTMEECINGNLSNALSVGMHTIGIAGALAMAIAIVSSIIRIINYKNSKRIG